MGGGGGGETTREVITTESSNEPPEYALPALKKGVNHAQDLFDQGIGAQPYTGTTVTPWSQNTIGAQDDILALAGANTGGQGVSGFMQGIIGRGGFTPEQAQSRDYLSKVGDNPFDLGQNAAYQGYKTAQLDDLQTRIAQEVGARGRAGSNMHTQSLVRELGRRGDEMDLAQMSRMDALNSQRFNLGQQGMGNVGEAYMSASLPAEDLMRVGQMDEDLYRRILDDELRLFNETQMLPWENLARMNAIATGAGQFGTQTTRSERPGQPQPSPWLTGISTGLAALGGIGSFL